MLQRSHKNLCDQLNNIFALTSIVLLHRPASHWLGLTFALAASSILLLCATHAGALTFTRQRFCLLRSVWQLRVEAIPFLRWFIGLDLVFAAGGTLFGLAMAALALNLCCRELLIPNGISVLLHSSGGFLLQRISSIITDASLVAGFTTIGIFVIDELLLRSLSKKWKALAGNTDDFFLALQALDRLTTLALWKGKTNEAHEHSNNMLSLAEQI
ncbi:MAG: hypothetical protein JSS86_03770, partial [Cyanobacteria bacterium SZAS LIN-2]|nr:hypothetical protein [Cyanobacteria bacterium SZAS LIN-2]